MKSLVVSDLDKLGGDVGYFSLSPFSPLLYLLLYLINHNVLAIKMQVETLFYVHLIVVSNHFLCLFDYDQLFI